jgi:hypothetical protein
MIKMNLWWWINNVNDKQNSTYLGITMREKGVLYLPYN